MRRFAPLCLFLALAACDSAPTGPVTPPVQPPVIVPPVEPPAPAAFSLGVTVRDAAGAPVRGLPVSLHFFPDGGARMATRALRPAFVAVSPSPWGSAARTYLSLTEATDVRVDLLDVLGAPRLAIAIGTLAAGQHIFALADTSGTLPGGAYTVRVIAGTDTLRVRTIHSDTGDGGAGLEGVGRALGTTDAMGRVQTADRTAVPSLYVPLVDFEVTDEFGNSLGTVRFGSVLEVGVEMPDGQQIRRRVTLRDGANAVEIRVP